MSYHRCVPGAASQLTTPIARFLGGALGLTGSAIAGTVAATALTNPASLTILGVIAAFAGGVAIYRGAKDDKEDERSIEILALLQRQMQQDLDLTKALANLPANLPASHEQTCNRIRAMHNVLAGDPNTIADRLAKNKAFSSFLGKSLPSIDAQLKQQQADLDRLIQLAINNGNLTEHVIATLDVGFATVIAAQGDHTEALKRIENEQATKSDLDRLEARLLAKLRASQPANAPSDEGTDRELVKAVQRLADDAERGVVTAQRIIRSNNPGDLVEYLKAKRGRVEDARVAMRARDQALDQEGIDLDRELAAVALKTGHVDDAEAAINRVLRALPDDLDATNRLGGIHRLLGRFDEAQKCFEILRNADSIGWQVIGLNNLGGLYCVRGRLGDLDLAELNHNAAIELSKRHGYPHGLADSLLDLSNVMRERDRVPEAVALARQSLKLNKELDRPERIALLQDNLGVLEMMSERFVRAEIRHRKALKFWDSDPNLQRRGNSHLNLGNALSSQEKFSEAEAEYKIGRDISERMGWSEGLASAHGNLGNIELERENWQEAESQFRKSLEVEQTLNRPADMMRGRYKLAIALFKQDNLQEAEAEWCEALRISEEMSWHGESALLHLILGDVHVKRENWSRAEEMYRKALEVEPTPAEPERMMYLYRKLGLAVKESGNAEGARQVWTEAIDFFMPTDSGRASDFRAMINQLRFWDQIIRRSGPTDDLWIEQLP